MTNLPIPPEVSEETKEFIQEYVAAAENLRSFREEVGMVLEKNEELTKEKTHARNMLDNRLLHEYRDTHGSVDVVEDLITVYDDTVLEIRDEIQAVRAIIQFCDKYKEDHNVDMVSSFLRILITEVRDRLMNEPSEFGLVDISQGKNMHWISPAFEIKKVRKVRVSTKV